MISETSTIDNNVSLEKKSLDNNRLQWVLDITIGYEKAKPLDLTDIVTGRRPPCTTHLHYRLYPSSEVRIILYLKCLFNLSDN